MYRAKVCVHAKTVEHPLNPTVFRGVIPNGGPEWGGVHPQHAVTNERNTCLKRCTVTQPILVWTRFSTTCRHMDTFFLSFWLAHTNKPPGSNTVTTQERAASSVDGECFIEKCWQWRRTAIRISSPWISCECCVLRRECWGIVGHSERPLKVEHFTDVGHSTNMKGVHAHHVLYQILCASESFQHSWEFHRWRLTGLNPRSNDPMLMWAIVSSVWFGGKGLQVQPSECCCCAVHVCMYM